MALEVFPEFEGIEVERDREPEFMTESVTYLAGNESRFALRPYPKTTFTINIGFLLQNADDAQFIDLLSFFYRHRGRHLAFLFRDKSDEFIEKATLGTANGTRVDFQLRRAIGGFFEPCHSIRPVVNPADENDVSPYIYVDNVLQAAGGDYTIDDAGMVTFNSAPADGAVVKATFNYYYRVRFVDDRIKVSDVVNGLFESPSLQFIGSPVTLV